MIITPAIIPEDYFDLQAKLGRLKGLCKKVQIDACDGKLTPQASWPYVNDREKHFDMVLDQKEGLPHWDNFDFEIDMMVRYPEAEYERWINAGGQRIVVHHYLGQEDRTKYIFREIVGRGTEAVIAFGLETSVEDILKYQDESEFNYLQNIQLMGIKNIGFQGEPFDMETVERVKKLSAALPDSEIAIDGGVNLDSAPLLAEAGAARLVIGSALFNSGDLAGSLDYFESL